jgi:hypothetical protein
MLPPVSLRGREDHDVAAAAATGGREADVEHPFPAGRLPLLHLADPAHRAAMVRSLQRTIGNTTVWHSVTPRSAVQRCTHGCGCTAPFGGPGAEVEAFGRRELRREPEPEHADVAHPVATGRHGDDAVLQRDGDPNPNVDKFKEVQGKAMFALLPALAGMEPAVLADEAAARFAGGPRLIVAVHAVQQKGDWKAFAAGNASDLASLPTDQIGDVMRFVGAPKNVGLYERGDFDGRFDGFVEPVTGAITLIFKVKALEADPIAPTAAEMAQFKAGFKSTVEQTWSGKGTIKPACPIPGVSAFTTRVVVHFVEVGEHLPVVVYPSSVDIGNISTDQATGKRTGHMSADAWTIRDKEQYAGQPQGKPLRSRQATAAHEFGHAIGIDHVHCKSAAGVCYGTTQQEWDDVMGGGMKLQRLNVGGQVHNDFAAFERIGERWGKDAFPGPLAAKCNKWGPG